METTRAIRLTVLRCGQPDTLTVADYYVAAGSGTQALALLAAARRWHLTAAGSLDDGRDQFTVIGEEDLGTVALPPGIYPAGVIGAASI